MTVAAAREIGQVQVRRVPLQGVVNFRDLGGYATDDGRRVKWGQVFRSDVLADLTDADLAILKDIGLRTLCDLRGEAERAHKPNRELIGVQPTVHQIGFMPHRGDELLADTKAGVISLSEIEARVREIYRRFVTEQAATFAQLLNLLWTEPLPMLIHCTSGRDRTGFASAVVLMALGVQRTTIAEDYALSNQYRHDLTFQIGAEVDVAVMRTLTSANPDYLAAAFAAIDDTWGSDSAYLRDGLRLSAEHQRQLRDRLLDRPPSGHAQRDSERFTIAEKNENISR